MSTVTRPGDETLSRRNAARLAIAGLAAPFLGGFGTLVGADEVTLGIQTSSFRDLPRQPGSDAIGTLIQALTECGARECELFAPLVEPYDSPGGHHTMAVMTPQMMRRELRKWRLRTPASYFTAIADRFRQAGIRIYAYNYSPDATFTDEEIDRGFSMAKALGAEIITASMTMSMARRVAPLADRHRMVVALGGATGGAESDRIASPADFAAALKLSPYFKVDADIGRFTAGHVDPIAFVRDHHADITSLHLKDCRVNGDAVAWGEGDAPIREVLQLLRRERWPIRVYVEYAPRHGDGNTVEEVKRCFAYAKQALA